MCISMIGPSLLDLQLRLGTSISHVNWLLSAQGLGTFMGVLIVGMNVQKKQNLLNHAGIRDTITLKCRINTFAVCICNTTVISFLMYIQLIILSKSELRLIESDS